ncbi:hypothetical protein PAXRUDRAFT_228207 [Paxillus rubicundulus Ve08.2h10]|uniref:DUF6534 domain-containing protein n=1 Tax=Paxillus rubicundulus Ve08.2h10 TaxID=930991 RepID=A0A0D0DGY4_9AGAM|nr:hypothetical protein PAXRUDRAFT_228207 [Paxillus rubicundulus Ve08.2h10]
MSSQPPSTLPSPAEIENLGVLFAGFVAATILYGLTFFQTYNYYSRYPRDLQWIRYLVALLCTLDTVASAIVSQVLYYYLIVMFDANFDILYATTTFCIQYMLSVLITFISQLFFAHRVFQVTGGSTTVTLAVVFLSFTSFVFGLTSSGQMFAQRRLSAFGSPRLEAVAAVSQSSAAVANVIIFVTMCYSLRPARYRDIAVPNGIVETTTTLLVSRGLAFTVVQIAFFGIFVALPSRPFWIPLHMIAIKFYVNNVLGLLNAREIKHGQGLNEEDSLTDRGAITDTRFPGAIRVDVDDTKATQQSVILEAQHTDIESQATELELRKTYQDGSGGECARVSTRSAQSQMDNDQDKISLSFIPEQ